MVKLSRILQKPRVLLPLSVFTILVVGFFLTPIILIELGYDKTFSFKLLSVAHPEIKCSVKHSSFVETQNSAGTSVSQSDAKQSRFYIQNPTILGLDILYTEGNKDPVTTFKVFPKLKCEYTSSKIPLEVSSATINMEVYSQNEKQTKVQTYSTTKQVSQITLSSGKEFTMTEFIIDPFVIEQKLGTKNYNSYMEFRTSGTINLNYVGFGGAKYQVIIPKDVVKTTYLTSIGEVVDNGIPSPNCPSNKLLKDGICVPKCESNQILENNQCVAKPVPIQCESGYEVINNQCVAKPPPQQNNPEVQPYDDIGTLLSGWFTALVSGNTSELFSQKYIGFTAIVGLLLFVMLYSALKPKKTGL